MAGNAHLECPGEHFEMAVTSCPAARAKVNAEKLPAVGH
jgi:hypothetical protein